MRSCVNKGENSYNRSDIRLINLHKWLLYSLFNQFFVKLFPGGSACLLHGHMENIGLILFGWLSSSFVCRTRLLPVQLIFGGFLFTWEHDKILPFISDQKETFGIMKAAPAPFALPAVVGLIGVKHYLVFCVYHVGQTLLCPFIRPQLQPYHEIRPNHQEKSPTSFTLGGMSLVSVCISSILCFCSMFPLMSGLWVYSQSIWLKNM